MALPPRRRAECLSVAGFKYGEILGPGVASGSPQLQVEAALWLLWSWISAGPESPPPPPAEQHTTPEPDSDLPVTTTVTGAQFGRALQPPGGHGAGHSPLRVRGASDSAKRCTPARTECLFTTFLRLVWSPRAGREPCLTKLTNWKFCECSFPAFASSVYFRIR